MTKRKRGRQKGNAKGRTKPGRLTPTGGNTREAHETARRLHRQYRALQLYADHRLSMKAVADVLTSEGYACTAKTVSQDIYAQLDREAQESPRLARHVLQIEDRKLLQIERALLPLAMGEIPRDVKVTGRGKKQKRVSIPLKAETRTRIQMDALSSLRRNGESRRKLHGVDKQPDEGYVRIEAVVAMVRGLVNDVLGMNELNTELRRQLGEAMRRRFGVIDVTPTEAT